MDVSAVESRLFALLHTPGRPLAGIQVVAINDTQTLYQGNYGYRYIHPTDPSQNLPIEADTKFRIASISKLVMTIGAMQLVEQDKLRLDQDLSEYLGFSLRNPHFPAQAITLRQLLSHTSSIRDGSVYSAPMPHTLRDFFEPGGAHYENGAHWAKEPPGYFSYANLNFGIAGTLIEAASGLRFDQYMRRHVFDPMNLAASYNVRDFSDADFAKIAVLYRKRPADSENWKPDGPWFAQVDDYGGVRPSNRYPGMNADTGRMLDTQHHIRDYQLGSNATFLGPQGGLRISGPDLAQIMNMLMNGGRGGVQILQSSSLNQMLEPQWCYDGSNGDNFGGLMCEWGLGVHRITHTTDKLINTPELLRWCGHFGDAYGLFSGMFFDPISKTGFVYLISGLGSDPVQHTSGYSAISGWEAEIISVLYEHVLKPHL